MEQAYIAVFDSGVGGVSVLRHLRRMLPQEHFLYYGDDANAPYGLHTNFATPATLEAVEEAIAAMQSRKMLTDLQAEAVDRELVVRFLASPLAQRIRTAEKVYREYRFALLVDAAMYDPSAAGEEMILQVVADCV